MSDTDFLVRERGASRDLGAYVVAAAFTPKGAAAFALGDGTVHLPAHDWRAIEAHGGGILAMASWNDGWATGGDDGRLCHLATDGTAKEISRFGSKWVEQVASGTGGILAAGVGKTIHLFGPDGARRKELVHPSTVTGIAFDAKGKRVGGSHYGGVTLWFVGAKVDSPRLMEWKGSHTGIAIHPAGDAVVSAMQENALHGWRLSDGQHMRMSGYPAKTESLSFSRNGKWLASSGAESVVMWPFFGGGPMGKAPTELAGGDAVMCSRVAFHPQQEMVAAGFSDGLVVLADVGSERILPISAPGHGPVTALAWSADGSQLAFGTEAGFAAVVDLSRKD